MLVRHLVQDEPRQASLARRFISCECSRETPCFINRIVLCELVWVLESAYGYPREMIMEALDRIMRTGQLKIEDTQSAWSALREYRNNGADFADCLLMKTNEQSGCDETVTFDKKAGAMSGARLLKGS